MAEALAKQGALKSPVVEATGTGGGIKLFCDGVGEATPDLVGASRKIKQSEIDTCAQNGVAKITEIPIGHDGIVVANSKAGPDFNVTRAQLFLEIRNLGALALDRRHARRLDHAQLPGQRRQP